MYIHLQVPIPVVWAEPRARKARDVPQCVLDGFGEIRATLYEGMAGTTILELATSAVVRAWRLLHRPARSILVPEFTLDVTRN